MKKHNPETIKKNLLAWQAQQLLKDAKKPARPLTHQPFAAIQQALQGGVR